MCLVTLPFTLPTYCIREWGMLVKKEIKDELLHYYDAFNQEYVQLMATILSPLHVITQFNAELPFMPPFPFYPFVLKYAMQIGIVCLLSICLVVGFKAKTKNTLQKLLF